MTSIRQDIVYGLRTLAERPAFTAIAVLSLALGIAVNTTMFSIVNATLFGSFGYENEDEIVVLATYPLDNPAVRNVAGWREYVAWQDAGSFTSMGILVPGGVRNLGATTDGVVPAEELSAVRLDPALFRTLGLRPQLGRVFTDEEDQIDNTAPVVLISDRFWSRRFGRSPAAVGQTLRLDGELTTIIGVMPEGSEAKLFQPNADIWMPSTVVRAQSISDARFIVVFARLAQGISAQQAQLEMDGMGQQMAREFPDSNQNTGFRVMSVPDFVFGLSQLLFVYNVIVCIRGGERATDRVWEGAHGLEWTLPSPAPYHSFSQPPVVK